MTNHDCLFCEVQQSSRTIAENTLAFLIEDAYPVTEGHVLAIPKRHVDDPTGGVRSVIPEKANYKNK
jgi:diadenosine tetraphosphate (Ap4A) HIT family hydrolase